MKGTLLKTLLPIAAALLLAWAPSNASGDALQLTDGRFFHFPKVLRAKGGYEIPFSHGKVFVPETMVLNAYIISPAGTYEPKNDEERQKVAKGLVPFEGKWIKKEKFEKILLDREGKAKKMLQERKKHMLWRNRYIYYSPHFQFEYTIAPEIFQNYMLLMENYYKVFAKKFRVRPIMDPKTKGRLKVCFYHDDEYYYQVSGAPRGAIGYFKFVAPLELNFFYDRTDEYLTLSVLYHECNHYLVHLINPNFVYPHWLAEGMAEYYGGSHWDPVKKKLTVGLLQEGRIVVLKDVTAAGQWLGLEEMIRMQNFGGLHYAWAWSFVHMMMNDKKYAKRFEKYFVHMAKGKGVNRTEYGFGKQTVSPAEQIRHFQKFMGVRDILALQEKWYDYVKKLDVKTGRGYALAGDWAMRWGLKIKATRYYSTAIEKGVVTALTYDKLGKVLDKRKKMDEAIKAFRLAVELDPLNARYTMHLGNALYKKDKGAKESERLMRLALEMAPDDTYLRFEARHPDVRKRK